MSDTVLNPGLYAALQRRFGKVLVSGQGLGANIEQRVLNNQRFRNPRGGEYYRVCCPNCGDRRFRLWVSHLYGTLDASTGRRHLGCAYCFNCDARPSDLRMDLVEATFMKFGNHLTAAPPTAQASIGPASPPAADFVPLPELPSNHAAIAYLRSRDMDLKELDEAGWKYCCNASSRMINRRIFIPVYHELIANKPELVGWQTRAIPNHSDTEDPKYYTMPGFTKGGVLYNLYRARRHDRIVLVEGAMDAARVGPSAVALFGSNMTVEQTRLLLAVAKHARCAIMLDGDAAGRKHVPRICQDLNASPFLGLTKGAFIVNLPSGDPGDYTREQLIRFVEEADTRRAVKT